MTAFFRVDASEAIGMGHFMRCCSIAKALKCGNCHIVFIMKSPVKAIRDMLDSLGFSLSVLPSTVTDWREDAKKVLEVVASYSQKNRFFFVDHYGLGLDWETLIKNEVSKLTVIADQPKSQHDCDVLIDQTYGRKEKEYDLYVSKTCKRLLGSQYALIAGEFQQYRDVVYQKRKNNASVKRILISFGGSDRKNLTRNIFEYLPKTGVFHYDIVLGSTACHLDAVSNMVEQHKNCMTLHFNCNYMAKLMYEADMAIGSAGSSSWERCCLALPSLALASVDNQNDILNALVQSDAAYNIGYQHKLDEKKLMTGFSLLTSDNKKRASMAKNAGDLCDGRGVSRVIEVLGVA